MRLNRIVFGAEINHICWGEVGGACRSAPDHRRRLLTGYSPSHLTGTTMALKSWCSDLGAQILAFKSWCSNLGAQILVLKSWRSYRDSVVGASRSAPNHRLVGEAITLAPVPGLPIPHFLSFFLVLAASASSERKVSAAEAAVAGAEQRLAEVRCPCARCLFF